MNHRLRQAPAPSVPTDRQRLILTYLAMGLTDRAAAAAAFVSERTLQREIGILMERLGVVNRLQLGVKAARRGWLAEPDS